MATWEQVLDEIVHTRRGALVGYAYLLCGDVRAAEDLVQEALVRTFARGKRSKDFQLAEGYVRTAIANVFLDEARRVGRRRGVQHLLTDTDTSEGPAHAVGQRLDVQRALAHLAPRERACVVLRHFLDYSVNDIAAQLSLAPGTVKRYLHDGRATLACHLGSIDDPGDSLPVIPKGGSR